MAFRVFRRGRSRAGGWSLRQSSPFAAKQCRQSPLSAAQMFVSQRLGKVIVAPVAVALGARPDVRLKVRVVMLRIVAIKNAVNAADGPPERVPVSRPAHHPSSPPVFCVERAAALLSRTALTQR